MAGHALKSLFAVLPYKAVGVIPFWKKDKADALLFWQRFKAVFKSAPGSLFPRSVPVKTIDDAVNLAQQLLYVRRGRRGSERGDGVANAVLGERDDIHVAFDNDRSVFLAQG